MSEPVQLTLQALTELAKGAGKTTLENIQLAFIAVDSRMSDKAIALRNLTIGHLLISHQDRLNIDLDFKERIAAWYIKREKLRREKQVVEYRWSRPDGRYDRKVIADVLVELNERIKLHDLQQPLLLDYSKNRYLRQLQLEIARFFYNSSRTAGNWQSHARAFTEKHGLNAGAITLGLVVVNFFNTMATYELASRDGELNAKDWAKVGSAAAYTGNALMAVFVETAWAGMKGLAVKTSKKEVIKITQRSAAYWASMGKSEWGALIKGFGTRLIGLGGFLILAASLELWEIADNEAQTEVALERDFLSIKNYAVWGILTIGGIQAAAGVFALSGHGFLIPFVMSSWFVAGTAIVGLIYLFVTYALNYLKSDAIGRWLHKCRWSRALDERFIDETEENQLFLEVQLSPSLFVKPTFEVKQVYSGRAGYLPREVSNGAWIQLRIPAFLRGEIIHVNLTASDRPGYVMPVKASGGSLQEHFIGYGTIETTAEWSKASDQKTQIRYNDPPSRTAPPRGEDVIWQTWIPITDNAEYLELQVWYPTAILPAKDNDKCYRYQIELKAEGLSESNSHTPSDGSVLSVEGFGGRTEAAILPIVG
ncbi:hypothetical protein [Pseudomonas sp. DWP3-1-2]|uniref:hypothetical protein n=1 Tax=Pseudomonas sp. DWP3-1-2 TaxID=2804645 RepID=UPI003CF121BE